AELGGIRDLGRSVARRDTRRDGRQRVRRPQAQMRATTGSASTEAVSATATRNGRPRVAPAAVERSAKKTIGASQIPTAITRAYTRSFWTTRDAIRSMSPSLSRGSTPQFYHPSCDRPSRPTGGLPRLKREALARRVQGGRGRAAATSTRSVPRDARRQDRSPC